MRRGLAESGPNRRNGGRGSGKGASPCRKPNPAHDAATPRTGFGRCVDVPAVEAGKYVPKVGSPVKWAPELAEGIGVFALVFSACGAIAVSGLLGTPTHLGISLVFGLVIAGMIYAVGHVSGAHFNPAVTIAFAATNHFPWARVPQYIAAQLTGGVLGSTAIALILPDAAWVGATVPHTSMSLPAALAVEILLTTILMFVIAGVATDGRAVGAMAGNAIGGTVALSALWAGPLTGASMNPARSLGPAFFQGELGVLWLYIVGPIIGALIGARLYEWTRRGDRPVREAA